MTIQGIERAFIARVGTDVDVRTSQAGKPWASFRACVGDKDDAQWLQIAVFGDRANSLAVAKGDRVYCEGRLKLESWTSNKDGQERQGLKVAAWRVERLGEIGKNKPAGKAPAENSTAAQAPAAQTRGNTNGDRGQSGSPARDWQRPAADYDIPFSPERRG